MKLVTSILKQPMPTFVVWCHCNCFNKWQGGGSPNGRSRVIYMEVVYALLCQETQALSSQEQLQNAIAMGIIKTFTGNNCSKVVYVMGCEFPLNVRSGVRSNRGSNTRLYALPHPPPLNTFLSSDYHAVLQVRSNCHTAFIAKKVNSTKLSSFYL